MRDYLDKIETCNCAPLEYVIGIYNLETIFLYLLYLGVVFNAILLVYPDWIVQSMSAILNSKYSKQLTMFALAYIFIMVGIMIAFIYNVYEYHQHIKADCSCIDPIESDMLYIQAVYYGIGLVIPVLTTVAIFTMIASGKNRVDAL